jgi:hypothetical protein
MRGIVGEERRGKETDRCPLTDGSSARPNRTGSSHTIQSTSKQADFLVILKLIK